MKKLSEIPELKNLYVEWMKKANEIIDAVDGSKRAIESNPNSASSKLLRLQHEYVAKINEEWAKIKSKYLDEQ